MTPTAVDQGATALSLAEALLLVAIDDDANRVPSTQSFKLDYGLAGALLLDLLLIGRLRLTADRIAMADAAPTGNTVLDDAVNTIGDATKPRDAKYWVNRLAGDHLRNRVVNELEQRQIVRREEHRVLWLFPADRFPTQDPAPEKRLRARLRAVLLDGQAPEPRDTALVALLKTCDLLGVVLSHAERQRADERITALTRPEASGTAVSQTIAATKAANDAVLAAVIAAVVAASIAASSAATTAGRS